MKKSLSMNTSFLVHVVKTSLFNLLEKYFAPLLISEKVKKEAVDEGKEKGYLDAYEIEKKIEMGEIRVVELDKRHKKMKKLILEDWSNLGEGEVSGFCLAHQEKLDFFGSDDIQAMRASEIAMNVTSITSGTIITIAFARGDVSYKMAKEYVWELYNVNLSKELRDEILKDIEKIKEGRK